MCWYDHSPTPPPLFLFYFIRGSRTFSRFQSYAILFFSESNQIFLRGRKQLDAFITDSYSMSSPVYCCRAHCLFQLYSTYFSDIVFWIILTVYVCAGIYCIWIWPMDIDCYLDASGTWIESDYCNLEEGVREAKLIEEVCLTRPVAWHRQGNIDCPDWLLSRSIANCNKSVDIRLVITLIPIRLLSIRCAVRCSCDQYPFY